MRVVQLHLHAGRQSMVWLYMHDWRLQVSLAVRLPNIALGMLLLPATRNYAWTA